MADAPASARLKQELLALVRVIPTGRVATHDDLARRLQIMQPLLQTVVSRLSEDERDMAPWHRVVAKGGAIGRGPHRDAQFARLVRDGVGVSPAGIVQDIKRVQITAAVLTERLTAPAPRAGNQSVESAATGRSRGMKDRPRGGAL